MEVSKKVFGHWMYHSYPWMMYWIRKEFGTLMLDKNKAADPL